LAVDDDAALRLDPSSITVLSSTVRLVRTNRNSTVESCFDDENVSAVLSDLHRAAWQHDGVGCIPTVSVTLTNWPGQSHVSSLANFALSDIVPVTTSTWLSIKASAPVIGFCG